MKLTKTPDAYIANYAEFGKDFISSSMLSLLTMCGYAFYLKCIEGWNDFINVRQTCGIAAHKARAVNLTQKIDSLEDMDIDSVKDAARDEARERFETHEYIPTKEFQGKSKEDAKDISINMGVEIAGKDYDVFQRYIIPAGVEESVALEYPGLNRIVVGRMDVREVGNVINDFKTSKAAYGQRKADDSPQLTTYGMLHLGKFGAEPILYRVQNIVNTGKGGCRHNEYETTRTREDLQRQLMRYVAACKAIDAGNFIPCNPQSWKCSPEYCGMFSRCKFGGAKLTGVK